VHELSSVAFPAAELTSHFEGDRLRLARRVNTPDSGVTMKSELDKLYSLIQDIEIAMMTTRRPDGHLESRAMANQKPASGADLWFVTAEGTAKVRDIEADPHVNLSYYKDASREWISVSGIASLSRDRQKIRELYAPDWKAWFEKTGDPRDGTPEDPRFVLIGVDIHAAVFLEVDQPRPVVLFEVAKGWLTGETPDVGTMHELEHPHRR
jgi:general stress protein 26